ncbi:MAG: hypothetical protein ACRERX_14395, partial [Pseudomonas sp.]
VAGNDGFLVLDRNFNGSVDNATELLSNPLVADPAKGLRSLAAFDANGDGRIDALALDCNTAGFIPQTKGNSLLVVPMTRIHGMAPKLIAGSACLTRGNSTFCSQVANDEIWRMAA